MTTTAAPVTTPAPDTTPAPVPTTTKAIETTGINITTLDPSDITWGDADCSGKVDVSDAVLICRYATEDAGARITDQGKKNADVDGSGNVTADDTIKILKYIAKLINADQLAPQK